MNLEKIIAVRNTKTIFKDKNNCIKLFYYQYEKSDILNEALNQSRVEGLSINVPKIKSIESFEGKWAIITEFIEGNTMATLLKKNPNEKENYLNRFIDLQLNVQSNECPLLTQLKDKLNKRINNYNFNDDLKNKLLASLEELPNGKSLCHGDFNLSNIIVGIDGKDYILDWSHATQGNPLADAAKTYLLLAFHNGIELARNYLNIYCAKAKCQEEDIKKWITIVASAQLIKSNEEEREFLYSFIK